MTRLSHSTLACFLVLALARIVSGQAAADNPTGVTGVYNGNITTAGSYDPFTGNQMRVVDDLVVPRSVGAYPLKWTRYYNTNVQDGQWTFSYKDYKDDALNFNIFVPDGRHLLQSASDGRGVPDYGVPVPADGRTYPGIFLSDGGQVLFKKFAYATTVLPVGLVDPYGQVTQITYNDLGGSGSIHTYRMDKVIEPGGRFLQLTWQTTPATSGDYVISKVEAFDGRGNSLGSVQYSWSASTEGHGLYARLDQATYADGTSAHYTYGTDTLGLGDGNQLHFPNLLTADDVRYEGAMRQISYGVVDTGGNWIPVRGLERNLNTNEVLSSVGGVSNDKQQLPDGTWKMTYVMLGETRGDGATRTFTYAENCTWTHQPSETAECDDITKGKIIAYTDFLGHTTQITYDENSTNKSVGYINSVTDPNGLLTAYVRATPQHNTWNITQVQYPDGSTVEQTYTDDANPYYLASRTLQHGPGDPVETINYTRDGNHRIHRKDYPDGGWEEFDYNNLGEVTQHRRCKDGSTVETETFIYDNTTGPATRGLKTSYQDATGGLTTYSYYTSGPWTDRVQTITYPANASGFQATETYEYDRAYDTNGENSGASTAQAAAAGRGLVTRIINTDGTYKAFGYNKYGDKLWEEDELRHRTGYTYDEYGRVRTAKTPLNHITTNDYTFPGKTNTITTSKLPFTTTLPSGKQTTFEYDGNWRKRFAHIAPNTSDAATTEWRYDEGQGNIGHLTKMVDPRGNATTYGYDLRDRENSVTDALNHTSRVIYDQRGLKISETHANNELIEYDVYDAMYRLTHKKVHRDATAIDQVSMGYDCAGNLQSQIDENGNSYAYDYDAMNRPTLMNYPNSKTEIHEYDLAGNLKKYTNRSGAVQTFSYDNRNRQTGFSWSDGTSSQSASYDAASRKTEVDNADATITLGYDDENHLKSQIEKEITPGVGDNVARTVSYTYDADGNRQNIQYPSGAAFNYTYTQRNQVQTISPGLSGGTPIVTYQFDASGNIQNRALDNGTSSVYTPDQVNRDTAVVHNLRGTTRRFDYVYNSVNDVLAVQRDGNSHDADGYNYDLTQQIVEFQQNGSVNMSTGVVTGAQNDNMMKFDGCGNRTSLNNVPETFNNMNQPTDVPHDIEGNVQNYNGFTYTYDAQNRLRQAAAAGFTESFYYDGLNRQVARVTTGAAPNPTPTPTPLISLSPLPTISPTPTVPPVSTPTPTVPPLNTPTVPPVGTPTATPTATATATPTATPTPTPTPQKCAPVTFSTNGSLVLMSTNTQGATIFYTENTASYGGAPQHTGGTAGSNTYIYNASSPPDYDCDIPYIEAIAYKAGMTDSDVTEANYDFWHAGCKPIGGSPSTMSSSQTTTTVFSVWDGDWAILEEYDASGTRIEGYVQGYHGLIKTLVNNTYYYQDQLGSTSHVANTSGQLLEYYRYDLYGKPAYFNANGVQLSASGIGVSDLGDGGSRWRAELGLYDDRNRFMSPDSGRFLQSDPIGFKGDPSNLYRYCGNDWANRADPLGLFDPEVFLIRDPVPNARGERAALRAAGTYFIVDHDSGKTLGSWRANKGGENDFIRGAGIKPGRYMIRPKEENGNYPKGQPAVTGLSPGLRPGQPNNSYPPGSALIHGPGQSAGCITVPAEAENTTRELMNKNGGRLPLQIENGQQNRAVPVTDSKGDFKGHKMMSTAEVLGANYLGYIAVNGAAGGGTSWGQQTSGGFVDAPGSNINMASDVEGSFQGVGPTAAVPPQK